MMNEYDIEEIHRYMEEKIQNNLELQDNFNETKNPTRMNIIMPIIPQPARNVMDLTLLVMGANLNVLLSLIILRNSSMRTTTNCYILSLVCSNLMILIEPLQQVLRWLFDMYDMLTMNLDYIFLVTFDTSMVMIVQLNIEAYVVICHKNLSLRTSLLKVSTAVKGVLFTWIMCIILTCLELKLYEHFEEEIVYDICASSTFMFLVLPCLIFITLECFILYDLRTMRSMDGKWPTKDVEYFVLLVCITVGFVLFVTPYRVVRSIALLTAFCCDDLTIEIVYTLIKMYPIILPLTCLLISAKFRQALEVTLCCEEREISVTT